MGVTNSLSPSPESMWKSGGEIEEPLILMGTPCAPDSAAFRDCSKRAIEIVKAT